MSILTTKIKALIDKITTKQLDEDLVAGKLDELADLIDEAAEDGSEAESLPDLEIEEVPAHKVTPPAPAPPVVPEHVSLEWSEVAKIKALQQLLKSTREKLGLSLIARKQEEERIMKDIESVEESIVAEINRMRSAAGLPDEVDYVLNLPATAGESGSFVKTELATSSKEKESA